MGIESQTETCSSDPAAVFACASSLWQELHRCAAREPALNLSEAYNGLDQLMREVMRVGSAFEKWACAHIRFEEVTDVWPYVLQDQFGTACLGVLFPTTLAEFNEQDCLRVALRLRLPVIYDGKLPLPVDLRAKNPVLGSTFQEFQIQTVRDCDEDAVAPFVLDDDPFDEEFSMPYFALYGVAVDGTLEHIADRRTYAEVVALVQRLAPGIAFPTVPTVGRR